MRKHLYQKRTLFALLAVFFAGLIVVAVYGLPRANAGQRKAPDDTEKGSVTPTPYERVAPKELPKKYAYEENDKVMLASRLPSIRVDGAVEEDWNVCEVYELANPVFGDEGASAQFRAFSDKEKLYLCIEVTDATPFPGNEVPTRCDSVEVFLNEDGTKPNRYHSGDSHYFFLRDGTAVERSGADLRLVNYAVSTTDQGYVVELAFTWSLPAEDRGDSIGLDIRVNDSKSEGNRDYIIQWSDTSMNTHEDLSQVGTLTK